MKRTSFRFAVIILLACAFAGITWAQFPKIPKIMKKLPGQSKSDDAKSPQGPMPALTSITPDSAPPGGSGDLVLAGKNLVEGVRLRMGCTGSGFVHIDSIKIESSERAVAHVSFPDDLKEGPCEIYLEFVRGANSEIQPSTEGTPEVVQVRSVSFGISNSSTSMPVGLGAFSLLSDQDLNDIAAMDKAKADSEKMAADMQAGKINMMDPDFIKKMQANAMIMQKMVTRAQQPKKDTVKGFLLLSAGSVSFVLEGKTIFNQPVSKLKEVNQIEDPMDSSSKILRVAFSDGKAYGLKAASSSSEDLDRVKKKLGK